MAFIFAFFVILHTGLYPMSILAANTVELQAEINALQKELDSIGADKQDEQEYQYILNQQIDALNAQLDEYQRQINNLNAQISEQYTEVLTIKEEINALNNEIEKNLEQLKMRMRHEYMSNTLSWWEILISSTDLTDFMYNVEYAKRDAERTQHLKDTLNKQANELDAKLQEEQSKLDEIEQKRATVISLQEDMQKNADDINAKIAQSQDKSKQLSEEYQKTKAKQDELAKARAEADADLDNFDGNVTPSATGFICPLRVENGYSYGVSQFYKPGIHNGVDFYTGGKANPIYASKSGEVKTAKYSSSYGNYVQIDHGGGDSTLYAHCSSIRVSYGEDVAQGQLIGYVGNTGDSTGYHLHFEMKINGNLVDPLKYITIDPKLPYLYL